MPINLLIILMNFANTEIFYNFFCFKESIDDTNEWFEIIRFHIESFYFIPGVGYGMVIVSAMACIYYNTVLSWVIYFLYNSFSAELPWAHCGHWWNTPTCIESKDINATIYSNISTYNNISTYSSISTYSNLSIYSNMTDIFQVNVTNSEKPKTAAEEFWQ